MIRLVLFDLDGTLHRGTEPFPEAVEAVRDLARAGLKVRYLTNNSALTQAAMAEKLFRMGFPVQQDWCFGTGPAASRVCRERGYRSVMLVGEPGLADAFSEANVDLTTAPDAAAVVVGVCRSFSYALLDQALQALLRGADFLATNRDPTYPLEGGRFQPGAGAMVAAVATASQREPEVIGKPSPTMLLQAMLESGVEANETLMVGDRLDTDLAAAKAAGCHGLLTLTGATPGPQEGAPFVASLRGLAAHLEALA